MKKLLFILLACLPLLVYAHSDVSGRSVSDMPFGQDGVT